MLDGIMRGIVARPLAMLARRVRPYAGADAVTAAGLGFGLAGAALVAAGAPSWALAGLALSRLCDGLDGELARQSGMTDRGGYLDIVCDFVFYGAFPFGFAVLDPARNALPACGLLLAFYINGATFLAFAAVAARRGMKEELRGPKALYFTTGLAEGTETIAVFAAMCLWPGAFAGLAWAFAAVCVVTAAARVALAWRVFA